MRTIHEHVSQSTGRVSRRHHEDIGRSCTDRGICHSAGGIDMEHSLDWVVNKHELLLTSTIACYV
jgi:hypothetical protein